MLMFDINAPRIRFATQDSNHSNLEENFKVSDKGTHHTFERITDHASLSITFSTLCDSKEDYYYEARMRGSNNSFAVGMIPYYHEAALHRENFAGSKQELEDWRFETKEWDMIMATAWPHNTSYTYHGDTGKIWHENKSLLGGPFMRAGSVVGWGIIGAKKELYFTVNGFKLAKTFDITEAEYLHPLLAFKGEGAELDLNYGLEPFIYQPKEIMSPVEFPAPESFSDEWMKQIGTNGMLPHSSFHENLKDVTILSREGIEIHCHGLVLATRSPVFKAILNPFKKCCDNKITIKDFDATTISKMLRFMYSDKIKEENVDMDLLGISNMYQVEALQHVCERQLSKELDVENVLDAWKGAHLFKREMFLHACEKFIVTNWEEVKKTDPFSRLLRENPDAVRDAVATLAVKMLNIQATINTKD